MRNLYSITKGQKAIWDLAMAMVDHAGIWREWEGDRGTKAMPDLGKHLVFSFMTTDASPDAKPIHPDATPVLLLDENGPGRMDGRAMGDSP